MAKTEITCCPQCHNETLEFTIEESGSSFDGEVTGHWASGYGKCLECGWEGDYSDSSP